MRIRPFHPGTDFAALAAWTADERTHALWCGDRMPHPLTCDALMDHLAQQAQDWGTQAFTALDDSGAQAGFYCCAVNAEKRQAFFTYVLTDHTRRGQGLGTQMMRLALAKAFEDPAADCAALNVYDLNPGARRCYEKAGFETVSVTPDVFAFEGERWGRCLMRAHRG